MANLSTEEQFPDDYFDDEPESDEWEEDEPDCHGHFDGHGSTAVFVCGAVGSEDCEECSCHAWLGLTNRQIDELELEDE